VTQPLKEYDFYNMDPFFRDLGDLQSKFLSLEFYLRTFLFQHGGTPAMQNFDSISVGDLVDENAFTSWDSLGILIDKYNQVVQRKDPALVISRGVVEIRDALAHGRVYRRSVKDPPRLLKFSRVDKTTQKVKTEFAETLTPPTLSKWNLFMFMTLHKVQESL